MRIIELSELQFSNYSKLHSQRNIFQTIEYAKSQEVYGFKILYLGLIDEKDNLMGATLLLEQSTLKTFKIGYIPGGFLINYNNFELLSNFTTYLKEYLIKNKYIYIRTNSLINIKEYDNNFKLKKDNSSIINNLKKLNYNFINLDENFLKYKTIINNDDIQSIYYGFKRNVKRNINDALKMGITIEQVNKDEIDKFYSLVKKKKKKDINYYKNIVENFNNKNNNSELYFAILDGKKYLNNYIHLSKKEEEFNEELNNLLINNNDTKILNKKMNSDRLIVKYKNQIKEASNILNNFPNGLILSTALILKNNKEIYFFTSGYEEKYRHIRSTELLKWEIIKKYNNLGYKIFNLGHLSNNFNNKNDKYYGYNKSKLDFNGNIVEYSEVFDLVLNEFLYKTINATKIFNLKKKDLNK